MSIIHEALKKAEQERGPRLSGLRLYGSPRLPARRWRGSATAGWLMGLTAVGAVSLWLWWPSGGASPLGRTKAPIAQDEARGGADQPETPAGATSPLGITRPRVVPRRSPSNTVLPAVEPAVPATDGQTSAQSTFEHAREAESQGQVEVAKHYYRQAL